MNALWHPAIRADWLVLRRTGAGALARVAAAPALLLAGCTTVACGDFFAGYGWCLVAAALLALGGSHAIACSRLADVLERWRFGWCGALPVSRGATTCTLLLVVAVALLVSVALVAVLLMGIATRAPHAGDLPYALAGIDLGLVLGSVGAAVRMLRRGTPAQLRHEGGVREPLFALSWLDDPRLPHLLDWQRRSALVRWRRGSGGMMVALALFAVPDGATVLVGAGLVLFVISLTWLDVVLRMCVKTTMDAALLLRPAPLGGERLRTASFRYPLLAMACVLALAAAGAGLVKDGSVVATLGGAACVAAAVVWPLIKMRRATHDNGSSA